MLWHMDPSQAGVSDTDDSQADAPETDDMTTLILEQMERTKTYRRVYPIVIGGSESVVLRYINGYLPGPADNRP